jgi:hypothetical protein
VKSNYNIFSGCNTLEEAKKLFRKEAMKCHPDHDGDQDDFIQLKRQFDEWISNNNNKAAGSADVENMINEILSDYPEFANHVRKILNNLPKEVMEIEGLSEFVGFAKDNPKTSQILKVVDGAIGLFKQIKQ